MPPKTTLITGADGYLGSLLAQKYLNETDEHLCLWVRADSNDELELKRSNMLSKLSPNGHYDRISVVSGNLKSAEPFAQISARQINRIVHSAAVTRFNVEAELAREVNIEGARKLLEFARKCENLESVNMLSTVYSSGLAAGRLGEELFDGSSGFSNHYEHSKWLAEKQLSDDFSDLPWRILRIATAIADDNSGRVTQLNAFHNTLKLLFYGLLSVVPGIPEAPLYFVTGEFATEATFHISRAPVKQQIYNICHTREESLTLDELLDAAFMCFATDPVYAKRRIMRPLYADSESFKSLAALNEQFGAGVLKQALSSVVPFGDQLFIEKDIRNSNLRNDLPHYAAPDAKVLVEKSCQFLIKQMWRRGELARR